MTDSWIKYPLYNYDSTVLFDLETNLCLFCCHRDNDIHELKIRMKANQPDILFLAIFHKGSYIFHMEFNMKTSATKLEYPSRLVCCGNNFYFCEYDAKPFIDSFVNNDFLPTNIILQDTSNWHETKQLLEYTLDDDCLGIVESYLCITE